MKRVSADVRRVLFLGVLAAVSGLLIRGYQVIQSYQGGPSAEWTGPGLLMSLVIGAFVFWAPRAGASGAIVQDSPTKTREAAARARAFAILCRFWSSVVFLAAGIEWLLLAYRVDAYFTTSDTFEYARVGEASLASAAFWAGERPFTVPLAFKLSGLTTSVLREASVWFRVALFTQCQALLSLASLTFLAVAVASHVRVWWVRSLSAVILVAFGLTLDVSQWHKALLSESLSTTLLNIVIGLWLVVISLLGRWKSVSPFLRAILVGGLAGSTILYSFTRDVHMYFVLSGAMFMALGLAIRKIRTHPARGFYLLMTLLMFVVALLQSLSMRVGQRWVFPLVNVLVRRILPDEEARRFFLAAGAPLDTAASRTDLLVCPEGECTGFHEFLRSQDGRPLLEWIKGEGQKTYLRFLLSQGVESLLAPLQNIKKMVGADSTEYRQRVYPDPSWFLRVRSILFPRSTNLVAGLALFSLGLMILITLRSHVHLHAVVPAFLVASIYPLMFVVWHGDAVEVERHAFQIAYQIRLAVWMAVVFVLDSLWVQFLVRRNTAGAGRNSRALGGLGESEALDPRTGSSYAYDCGRDEPQTHATAIGVSIVPGKAQRARLRSGTCPTMRSRPAALDSQLNPLRPSHWIPGLCGLTSPDLKGPCKDRVNLIRAGPYRDGQHSLGASWSAIGHSLSVSHTLAYGKHRTVHAAS